jgi:molybdopterin molybdotransferase
MDTVIATGVARSPYREVPVDEARSMVLQRLAPLAPVRTALSDVLGRILAESITADRDMPPFAASAKDGFAVAASDGLAHLRLLGDIGAGQGAGVTLKPGEAARIATGAALPPGADAIVMVEDARLAHGTVQILREPCVGDNIRRPGSDFHAGETLIPAGTRIGPAEVGLLASSGVTHALAYPVPRVAVFSSGDELVSESAVPADGQIRDANGPALAAAVVESGARVSALGHLADDNAALESLLATIDAADLVVTSGGVSMGHRDLIKPWLAHSGEIVFGRVRTKPGKPVTFAIVRGKPVFALPGFPVSALVCFEVFVRPALLRLAGFSVTGRPIVTARAAHEIHHAADRTEFQRAVVSIEDGQFTATTTGPQGSGRLLSFAGANALLAIPAGTEFVPRDGSVTAWLTGPTYVKDSP